MTPILKLVLRHSAIGAGIALGFTALVVGFDVAGIGRLVMATEGGLLALVVFTVLCTITFASVQVGIRIMTLDEDDTPPARGTPDALAVPVRVEARPQR